MNKKIYILTAFLGIVVASFVLINTQKQTRSNIVPSHDTILFEKTEGWGPCQRDAICLQSTKLYYSGKLILEGEKTGQKQLNQAVMTSILDKIKATNVMSRDCPSALAVDYSATYKLFVDNKEKTIQFPGCEKELKEIEALIPPWKNNSEAYCKQFKINTCPSDCEVRPSCPVCSNIGCHSKQ